MFNRPAPLICHLSKLALYIAPSPEAARLQADIAGIEANCQSTEFDEASAYRTLRNKSKRQKLPTDYKTVAILQDPVQRVFNGWRYLANYQSFKADGVTERLTVNGMAFDPSFAEFIAQYSDYLNVSPTL